MSLSFDIDSLVPIQSVVAVRELVQQPLGRRFSIPFNQRPWVWKPRNLSDLWADLLETSEKFFAWNASRGVFEQRRPPTGNPHYFGAFVVYERDTNAYEVVDGQQRLTSVCMLAAVLRELAQGISDRSEGDLKLRNGANGMVTALTSWLQSNPAAGGLRLSLDPQYDELFRNYVVEPRSDGDRAAAYRQLGTSANSQRAKIHIKEGFDALRKIVVDAIGNLPDAELLEHVRTLEHVLGDAFISTLIVVNDEPFALSVFGDLNARGVPLGAADQIKNELFERTQAHDHQQIKDDWDAIVASIPNGNIELFLRQRYLAFVDDDCPKNQLYFRVRDKELVPNDPKDVVAGWRKDADLLSVLTTQTGHPKVKGELAHQLRTLHETLGVTYSWPLLLSAGRRFFPNDLETFQKLTRLTLAFCFRVLTIGKADVLDLERPLTRAAIELTRGATPNAVARTLREANSDEKFVEDFAVAMPRRASVQFYALYEIERYRSKHAGLGLEPFPHSPKQNIEHILPRNLSKQAERTGEWPGWRSKSDKTQKSERHRDYVNRLGNLLILEGEINRDVSNFDLRAKQTGNYPGRWATQGGGQRKCYADSTLKLAKDLCSPTKYSRWGAKTIEDRQAALALEAVNVWTLRLK